MGNNLRVIAKTTEIKQDLQPIILDIDSEKIALYRRNGKYYAFRNICPHQGGPSSEGATVGNVECAIVEGKNKLFASTEKFNIACPWHGIQFDIETGICIATPKLRLKKYEVIVEGDELKLAK